MNEKGSKKKKSVKIIMTTKSYDDSSNELHRPLDHQNSLFLKKKKKIQFVISFEEIAKVQAIRLLLRVITRTLILRRKTKTFNSNHTEKKNKKKNRNKSTF